MSGIHCLFGLCVKYNNNRHVLEGGIDSVKDGYHKYWWRSCMHQSDQCEGLSTGTICPLVSLAVINTFEAANAVGSATRLQTQAADLVAEYVLKNRG
jgi:hypothetical protein